MVGGGAEILTRCSPQLASANMGGITEVSTSSSLPVKQVHLPCIELSLWLLIFQLHSFQCVYLWPYVRFKINLYCNFRESLCGTALSLQPQCDNITHLLLHITGCQFHALSYLHFKIQDTLRLSLQPAPQQQ